MSTAQELAEEARLRIKYVASLKHDPGRQILEIETLFTCIDRLRDLAALASQAERECRHCGFLCRPNPAESQPWYPLKDPSCPTKDQP